MNYLAKGAKSYLAPVTPDALTAISIPLIAATVAFSMHRMRKALTTESPDTH